MSTVSLTTIGIAFVGVIPFHYIQIGSQGGIRTHEPCGAPYESACFTTYLPGHKKSRECYSRCSVRSFLLSLHFSHRDETMVGCCPHCLHPESLTPKLHTTWRSCLELLRICGVNDRAMNPIFQSTSLATANFLKPSALR
jgi:hypothetical protein